MASPPAALERHLDSWHPQGPHRPCQGTLFGLVAVAPAAQERYLDSWQARNSTSPNNVPSHCPMGPQPCHESKCGTRGPGAGVPRLPRVEIPFFLPHEGTLGNAASRHAKPRCSQLHAAPVQIRLSRPRASPMPASRGSSPLGPDHATSPNTVPRPRPCGPRGCKVNSNARRRDSRRLSDVAHACRSLLFLAKERPVPDQNLRLSLGKCVIISLVVSASITQ